MMVKNNRKRSFMSAPKRRGLTPQQRESAWLQSLATARNRSGYPLPAIPQAPRLPRRPQRAVVNSAPRARRAQQRNRSRAGYGPGAIVSYLGPPKSMENRQIGSGMNKNRPNGNGRAAGARFGGMSECARLYAIGIVNPFSFVDATATSQNQSLGLGHLGQYELPCLPNFPTLKTLRFSSFARGTMLTSTDGTGVIVFAPQRAANNYLVTNNSNCPIFVSNATAVVPGFPTLDTGAALATWITPLSLNTGYAVSQLVAPINYRVVGSGIRIRYAGSEMNMGGIIHCVEEPNHASLSGLTAAQVSSYESYFRAPVTRNWTDLVYTPTQQLELDMAVDPIIGTYTNHYMGMLIASAVASSLFEWEVVTLFEINGTIIRGMTYSETDMRGFEMVQNALRPENQLLRNQVGPSGIFKMIMDGANYLTRQVPAIRAVGRLGAAFL